MGSGPLVPGQHDMGMEVIEHLHVVPGDGPDGSVDSFPNASAWAADFGVSELPSNKLDQECLCGDAIEQPGGTVRYLGGCLEQRFHQQYQHRRHFFARCRRDFHGQIETSPGPHRPCFLLSSDLQVLSSGTRPTHASLRAYRVSTGSPASARGSGPNRRRKSPPPPPPPAKPLLHAWFARPSIIATSITQTPQEHSSRRMIMCLRCGGWD
ncbi:hypothetical protein BCR34DRAFT_73799 [Clohesyomyces aquaticus]|uniref:Uncharacterized protein n=1 Tax=Clohesyomyces aquaticus TaxID=1231657 RepID=A0A1Y2A4D7_9PLEO|nr:hypothetical protein BCR34DRAFT_73799 [Clohesyomyces aquaticus]